MYESYWGLRQQPFVGSLDPESYYKSPTHDEALARMHYLVENCRRLGVLFGPAGSGKSLLLRVFAHELYAVGAMTVYVNLLGVSVDDLQWSIAAQLGANPREGDPAFRIWQSITDRLTENRYQQRTTVLLLDDADEAAREVLTQVVRMIQLDPSQGARTTVILAADQSHADRLGSRLLARSELRIDLEPWQESETVEYVDHCLEQVGRESEVFDPQATLLLHELSNGVPRQVNQLAHLALLAAAGGNLSTISEHTIESVYHELVANPVNSTPTA